MACKCVMWLNKLTKANGIVLKKLWLLGMFFQSPSCTPKIHKNIHKGFNKKFNKTTIKHSVNVSNYLSKQLTIHNQPNAHNAKYIMLTTCCVLVTPCLVACDKTEHSQVSTDSNETKSAKKSNMTATTPIVKASTPKTTSTLNIAAASNLQFVLPLLVNDFNQTYPNIKVNVNFDTSVDLYDAISNKTHNYDVFLSSNQTFPKLIFESKKGQSTANLKYSKPFSFARGQLVLYSKKHIIEATPTSSLSDFILDNPKAKVMVANPQISSYGMATENWLVNQNLNTKIDNNLVFEPTIDDAFDAIEQDQGDFGFVALSQVINQNDKAAITVDSASHYAILPKDSYPPILLDGIIINPSEESEQFVDYLLTAKAQDVMIDAGYLPICQASNLLPACK